MQVDEPKVHCLLLREDKTQSLKNLYKDLTSPPTTKKLKKFNALNTLEVNIMTWLESVLFHIDATTVVLFIVVLVLTALMTSWSGLPSNIPPFPATAYPLVGHLPYLKDDPRGTVVRWSKEKGEIFSMWFGNRYTVFLNSFDIIKEAFIGNADIFMDRPLDFTTLFKDRKENFGITAACGKAWKVQRAVTMKFLRQFGMGKSVLADSILEEVKYYLKKIASFKSEPTNVRLLTNNSTANIICSIVLGRRFDYDDAEFTSLLEMIDKLFQLAGKANPLAFYPLVRRLPGDIFGLDNIRKTYVRISEGFVRGYIEKAKARLDSTDETDSYIMAYLREMKAKGGEAQGSHLNENHLQDSVYQLLIAGTDTTSTTLLWFMLYMLHFPDIQAKIYKEIVDVVGQNRLPEIADKEKMNFLAATIMETQRVASILPFNAVHMTNADITLRGYFIPKGTTINILLDAVLRDEKVWKDPLKFNPERFLDENGGLASIPEQFVPFSLGRRICAGESLAKMELFLYLSSVLQRFELQPADPNNLPNLQDEFGITCPPKPFRIRFVEREC